MKRTSSFIALYLNNNVRRVWQGNFLTNDFKFFFRARNPWFSCTMKPLFTLVQEIKERLLNTERKEMVNHCNKK